MKTEYIIFLVAAMMFAVSLFKQNKWSKIISGALALGIALTWTKYAILQSTGITLYVGSTASVVLYGMLNQKLPKLDRILVIILGICSFIALLFETMYWAHYNEVILSMILPLAAYVVLMIRGLMKKDEFVFSTLLFTHCLLRVLEACNF